MQRRTTNLQNTQKLVFQICRSWGTTANCWSLANHPFWCFIISDLHWLDSRCMRDWGTSNQGSVRSKSNGNTRCWRGIDKFCLGKNNCSIWLGAGYQHIGKQGNTELMFFLTKIKDSCLSFQRRKIRGKMQRTESETLRGAEMCFTFETMKLKIKRLKKEKSLRRSFTILQRQRLLSWA